MVLVMCSPLTPSGNASAQQPFPGLEPRNAQSKHTLQAPGAVVAKMRTVFILRTEGFSTISATYIVVNETVTPSRPSISIKVSIVNRAMRPRTMSLTRG